LTPFLAVAAVFAIQASAGAGPVLAFPLYLTVILLTALQMSRLESLATALLAGIGILVPSVAGGGTPGDMAPALLLAIVLLVAAVAITEVVRKVRESAEQARRRTDEVAASEERLRLMLEAAMVGLAVVDGEGRWVQVNDRLGTILGRPRDELLQLPLEAVTAEKDRAALNEALALLRSGDIVRWEADINQIRGDGTRVPVAIAIGAAPGHVPGESLLLVQESDISARKHLDGLRDCLVAIRHVIVGGLTWEQAVPQLLSSLCAYLDQDLAQFWAAAPERQALRVRHYWHRDASSYEALRDESRAAAIPMGVGLLGRVWQSGVVAAVEDLAQPSDYASVDVAQAAGLRSLIAFPVVDAGGVGGGI
jgi:PAS domain S-box-containing protein